MSLQYFLGYFGNYVYHIVFRLLFVDTEALQILLANSADVRLVSLDNPNKSEIIASKLNQAGACDYVYTQKLIFWIDSVISG